LYKNASPDFYYGLVGGAVGIFVVLLIILQIVANPSKNQEDVPMK
jgi:hypothetical protein